MAGSCPALLHRRTSAVQKSSVTEALPRHVVPLLALQWQQARLQGSAQAHPSVQLIHICLCAQNFLACPTAPARSRPGPAVLTSLLASLLSKPCSLLLHLIQCLLLSPQEFKIGRKLVSLLWRRTALHLESCN